MPVALNLAQRFARRAVSDGLLTPGMKLVVAVSGGADSVALLHLLQQARMELQLTLLAVHINHNLRGPNPTRTKSLSGACVTGLTSMA